MASIKVCLVVIVFIYAVIVLRSVHPEIDNLMVGELINLGQQGYFWVGEVHFSVGLAKELRVGDKN